MSQLKRNQRLPSQFRSSKNPRIESATQQNRPSTQLPIMPSKITLAENPTLAKEIQELIDKSRQSPAEAVTNQSINIHPSTDNGSSTIHTLQPNVEYVSRNWSAEDAKLALAFENTFKLLLVRFEDSPITEMSIRELGSSIRNVFVPEPSILRYSRNKN